MGWDSPMGWMPAIPETARWALAILAALLGLPCILWPERIIRGLRKWLLVQLKWIRSPGYRRALKAYGWLLFVTGVLLMLLLALTPRG